MNVGGGDKVISTVGQRRKKSNRISQPTKPTVPENEPSHVQGEEFKPVPVEILDGEAFLKQKPPEMFSTIEKNFVVESDFCAGVIKRNLAAVKIQSRFRGWLIRTNLKILTKCAIKIQALWRGSLVRMRNQRRLAAQPKSREDAKPKQKRSKSPRKSPRKKTIPVPEEIRPKGAEGKSTVESTKKSKVEPIGTPEPKSAGLFGMGSISTLDHQESIDSLASAEEKYDFELRLRMEKALQCLETILKDYCGEDLSKVSKERVSELINFLDTNPDASKSDVCLANFLVKLCPVPNFSPDDDTLVKPDPEKVAMLKEAIRLLRQRYQIWEGEKLYQFHHLARTRAIPGVYSDPFSGELSKIEKHLAELRFGDTNYISPAKYKTENTKQLQELVTRDPEESATLEKIYKFKFNHFPVEQGDVVLPNFGPESNRAKSPPPFTLLFKSNPKRRHL